ncbi:MAG: hypothetical protein JW871_05395 [Endomicrobiales bacterium]|nr:hypothetical protein [Endomicrobiales bacterium]
MDKSQTIKTINYEYKFKLPEGKVINCPIALEQKSLNLVIREKDKYPSWAELKYRQCSNCTLDTKTVKYCPIAKNMVEVIDLFKDITSDTKVEIEITSPLRNYSKKTTIEEGVSSIVGLYMATSGCPILDMLKPMTYYHLPFSSISEVKYRVITMYLMAQYLITRTGGTPDWELEKLKNLYREIQIVNKTLSHRFSSPEIKNMKINVLLELDCFAKHISLALIDDEMIAHMKDIFNIYMK